MAIQIACPECQSTYSVPEELRGKKARCARCNTSFPIAEQAADPLPEDALVEPEEVPAARETARPARRERRFEDDEEDRPRRKPRKPRKRSSALVPLLVVGGVLVTILAAVGAGVGVWAYWDAQRPAPNLAGRKDAPSKSGKATPAQELQSFWSAALPRFEDRTVSGTEDVDFEMPPAPEPGSETEPNPLPVKPQVTPAAFVGQLPPEIVQKVKQGTFYLRVTSANGQQGSGSGFLIDDAGTVVTNAHVLGMQDRMGQKPKLIEVFLHSGERNEKKVTGELLGLDRRNDLALLRIPKGGLPPPFRVKSAEELLETQPLWVSGFPYGEQLGKNVTLTECKVSSLRREGGALSRVQVHGDMQPGNSGGPVVDAQGDVVGVSVAIIQQTRINFAIPADAVLGLANGRIVLLSTGAPYREADQLRLPVRVHLQDPLRRLRTAAAEVWVGDPGPERATATARPSDGPRTRGALTYQADTGLAEGVLTLPEPPAGKTCWMQPLIEDGRGVTAWGQARPVDVSALVERQPIRLALQPTGQEKAYVLHRDTNLRLGFTVNRVHDLGVKMVTRWKEGVRTGTQAGHLEADRKYGGLSLDVRFNRGKPHESPLLPKLMPHLALLKGKLRLDADLRGYGEDWGADFNQVPESVRHQLSNLHAVTQQTLDLLAVPLPGKEVTPGESWKPTHARPLLLETFDIGHAGTGSMTWTYTLAGLRQRDGRTEAVVLLEGLAQGGPDSSGDSAGNGLGRAYVDPATGQVRLLEVTLQLDYTTYLGSFPIPLRGTTTYRLEEETGVP